MRWIENDVQTFVAEFIDLKNSPTFKVRRRVVGMGAIDHCNESHFFYRANGATIPYRAANE
jgi:hypothetical protein